LRLKAPREAEEVPAEEVPAEVDRAAAEMDLAAVETDPVVAVRAAAVAMDPEVVGREVATVPVVVADMDLAPEDPVGIMDLGQAVHHSMAKLEAEAVREFMQETYRLSGLSPERELERAEHPRKQQVAPAELARQ
jgi:hypothetical protein